MKELRKNIKWISEVNIGVGGNVDYVAVKINHNTGAIEDFLCIEFQAAGTTGTPWQAMIEFKKDRAFKNDSYNYGINWANEFMKTMMQQVYKKGKIIHSWERKIIFVVQDLAIDYLNSAVDTSDLKDAVDSDEIHFMLFKMEWFDKKWSLVYDRSISTDLEGINKILGGAHKEHYPTEQEFKNNIYSKGRSDGIL